MLSLSNPNISLPLKNCRIVSKITKKIIAILITNKLFLKLLFIELKIKNIPRQNRKNLKYEIDLKKVVNLSLEKKELINKKSKIIKNI